MNALRALILFPALAALVACGSSDRSGADTNQGVTVELPPFEPEQYAGVDEDENTPTSLNVMVPAASEGEPPPAAKPEPKVIMPSPESKAPPAELAKAPTKMTPVPTPKAPAATTPAPAASPAAKADEAAPRTPAVVAKLPISTERVASTIDRIGYPCGQVTSSAPVAGASIPTWKISCSSGATYRGTNRGGHMRFTKWSGN